MAEILIKLKNHPYPYDYVMKNANKIIPSEMLNYLGIEAKFIQSLSTVFVDSHGKECRNDFTFLVVFDNEDFNSVIDFEHQSTYVNMSRLDTMSWGAIDFATHYRYPVLLVIATDEESYKKSETEFNSCGSIRVIPYYIYFTWEEIQKRINNLKEKIKNNEKLNTNEYLDLGFLPIFSPKDKRPYVTRICVDLYKTIEIKHLRINQAVYFSLGMMIARFFDDDEFEDFIGVKYMPTLEEDMKSIVTDVLEEDIFWLKRELSESNEKIDKIKEDFSRVKRENEFYKGIFNHLNSQGILSDDILEKVGSLEGK